MIQLKDIKMLKDDDDIKYNLEKIAKDIDRIIVDSFEDSEFAPKQIAARMQLKDQSLISKWKYHQVNLHARRLAALIYGTNDDRIAHYLAQYLNAFLVFNSDIEKFSKGNFESFSRVLSEFADLTKDIAKAFQDGKITKKEAELIRAEWEILKSLGEGYVLSLEKRARGEG